MPDGIKFRVQREEGETLENTPHDVRVYVEIDLSLDSVRLYQGADLVILNASGWEQFCVEVAGAIIADRSAADAALSELPR